MRQRPRRVFCVSFVSFRKTTLRPRRLPKLPIHLQKYLVVLGHTGSSPKRSASRKDILQDVFSYRYPTGAAF